ncbi:hypothetical protein J3458_020517 [Metarhizium acridum]|uniref:uncharacterized protein n=1 Tax=Metarhizium acridum TaxID=92637 RepID=UPI001C6C928F|nr:hypothetical protein J3458_020517 [Metarhizium acridum]
MFLISARFPAGWDSSISLSALNWERPPHCATFSCLVSFRSWSICNCWAPRSVRITYAVSTAATADVKSSPKPDKTGPLLVHFAVSLRVRSEPSLNPFRSLGICTRFVSPNSRNLALARVHRG